MADVITVTVPEKYGERFQRETLFLLESAAGEIETVAGFIREGKGQHELSADHLQAYRDAELMFVEAHVEHDGDLEIEAKAERFKSAALGCALELADELKGETEKAAFASIGPVMDEFSFWRSLYERLDGEGGRG